MCEPTFEEWFLSFAAERQRLTGMAVDFDHAYDQYFPAFENGICGGTAPSCPSAPACMNTNWRNSHDALCPLHP